MLRDDELVKAKDEGRGELVDVRTDEITHMICIPNSHAGKQLGAEGLRWDSFSGEFAHMSFVTRV